MNIDLSPIMQAVDGVIARHERYIGYCKAREARRGLRNSMKGYAICYAAVKVQQAAMAATAATGQPLGAAALIGAASSSVSAIRSTPASLFCTDKPEIDPKRQKAYIRAERKRAIVLVGVNRDDSFSVSGIVDEINKQTADGWVLREV